MDQRSPVAMHVKQFAFNHYGTNCYVLWEPESRECAIIDPTAEDSWEADRLLTHVKDNSLAVKYLLLTHAHVDHLCGARQATDTYGLPLSLHEEGQPLIAAARDMAPMMGFRDDGFDSIPLTFLKEYQHLKLGNEDIECRYVPGHCPGSLCFVVKASNMVFTGDALFRFSIGRTDLPGGNYDLLMQRIRSEILTLDDDYTVLPGHGEVSTVGDERKFNPFLGGDQWL